MAASCDRLVAPTVGGLERARQRRLIAVLLAGPFVLAGVWPTVFAAGLPRDLSFGILTLGFMMAWASIAYVATRADLPNAASAALAAATMLLAVAIAGAGGLSSPVMLIAGALAFESWWVMRSRRALVWGGVAAAVAIVAQPVIGMLGLAPAPAFSAWHWLVPLAYGAIAAPRLASAIREEIEALRQPRETAVEDVLDAVVLRIARSGDTTDVGGRSEALLGVAPELLLGEGFFERVHVSDRVELMRALADADRGHTDFELRIRVAGDSAGTFRSFAAELHGGSPRLLVLRGNGKVEALRHELAEAREQAAGSDVAKARFLAAVSHELRTPLNAIIGFSDMLAYEMVGRFTDPRQKEYACLIRDSGGHLLSVVNSILDVSKIESGAYPIRPEPFRFAEAASTCHAMLALQAAEKSVELSNRVTPAVGEICADRRAVQQILINLLSNAVKFTPRGGSVKLDARRHGRMITFEVADTGIGIDEEDLARLGRPFVQVHNDYTRQFDGAGLGLSIAKGLVALHGGAMSIQSSPGAGTVVSVTLPIEEHAVMTTPEPKAQDTEVEEYDGATFRKSA
ncbi:HAMP domain-containing sensor histidine kinase [Mesorhizobium sp. J428]|uniref:sensor histidine kinase n=1 Tax=Mesorhizobium sp. J428 TaxID=2898440 RepID=UPI0021512CA6|nr:PAS domain-containing sensor histidine kinase [Mesorhizobium sp. J428]MCR5858890.1 PAS domain-containing sensor histidine kinase [Mesorhizobium sp. J428]